MTMNMISGPETDSGSSSEKPSEGQEGSESGSSTPVPGSESNTSSGSENESTTVPSKDDKATSIDFSHDDSDNETSTAANKDEKVITAETWSPNIVQQSALLFTRIKRISFFSLRWHN